MDRPSEWWSHSSLSPSLFSSLCPHPSTSPLSLWARLRKIAQPCRLISTALFNMTVQNPLVEISVIKERFAHTKCARTWGTVRRATLKPISCITEKALKKLWRVNRLSRIKFTQTDLFRFTGIKMSFLI